MTDSLRGIPLLLAGFAALIVAVPARTIAEDPIDGRILYLQYCASCHGRSGRGDGADAVFFEPRPTNLKAGVLKHFTAGDLARRVRSGTPLPLALDLNALRQHAGDVEELVAHLKRLPSINWDVVEQGWALYVDRCETCHGPTGKPPATGGHRPTDLSDEAFQKSVSNDALVDAVRHGRQGMPALTPRVSIEEGRKIAAFVRLFSPGFSTYSRICSNCHADDGRGVHSLGEVIGEEIPLPAVIFDKQYFARRSPEQIRHSVWHMLSMHKPQMPHFRYVLKQSQLEAILNYLKASER
jgi:mono/diheme cytochrome c family protein